MADIDPVLRSPLVADLLRLVLLEHREWTADELAAETATPYPTVTKEVRRLQRAGLVGARVVGRTKFLVATDDPVTLALGRAIAASTSAGGGDDMAKKKKSKKK
ncbi:MAG: winged helix-turn-helix domain-containing protein [Acidimicrobiia bacterium]